MKVSCQNCNRGPFVPWHEPRLTLLSSGGASLCRYLYFYLSLSCQGTAGHLFPESLWFVSCWHGSYCSDAVVLFKVFPALGLNSLKVTYLTCQWLSDVSVPENHQDGLLKHRLLDSTPRVSDSADLGWGLKMWISFFSFFFEKIN